MNNSTHLPNVMETSCDQCGSRFRITEEQLRHAFGKVCCGECGHVFNALPSLKTLENETSDEYRKRKLEEDLQSLADERTVLLTELDFDAYTPDQTELTRPTEQRPEISLEEAMYGDQRRSGLRASPLLWFIGILLLTALGFAQVIYYQRYDLIKDPRFQNQVIALCEFLPCAESQFSSTAQIRLLERNVFTHPISNDALMVTGSFVNQAPFTQKLPDLLISLFDVHGKLIANRLFRPGEYLLENRNRRVMQPEQPVQFRLELVDPGTNALTYEFEFF